MVQKKSVCKKWHTLFFCSNIHRTAGIPPTSLRSATSL